MAGPSTTRQRKAASAQKTRRTNRQAEVMQAAREIFWQKGYQAASIQDVADKVDRLIDLQSQEMDPKKRLTLVLDVQEWRFEYRVERGGKKIVVESALFMGE